jgi:phosphatidylserine decarboxylase
VSVVPLRWRFALAFLHRLPQGILSRITGSVADLRFPPPIQGRVNRGFARLVGIDLSEVERPPEEFPSLSEFFVRRLRPGVRRWPEDVDLPASPVDGIVGACGRIEEGDLIQAKGLHYTVEDLLSDPLEAARFRNGTFITIYLSPRHYHRIHSPVSGVITGATKLPGRLFPVNEPAVNSIPRLFPRNERLIAHLIGQKGHLALAAVGAFNVGRISAAFDPGWRGVGGSVTNRPGRGGVERRSYTPGLPAAQGDELMAFHLGSTVVLLLDEAAARGLPTARVLRPGAPIQLGEPLLEL